MAGSFESYESIPGANYLNPPVVEAYCEAYFKSTKWDSLSSGLFLDEVKEEFPKMEKRLATPAEIFASGGGSNVETERHLYFSEGGDQLIQLSSDFLVFNQLVPFRPFSEWAETFFCAVAKYTRLFRPVAVDMIGVRYINRIEIPERQIALDDFFTVYPVLPFGSGYENDPFMINCVIPQAVEDHILTVSFGRMESEEKDAGCQVFRLELYEQVSIDKSIEEDELREQVGIAHRNVVNAFEGSITDNLRGLFGREDSHEQYSNI